MIAELRNAVMVCLEILDDPLNNIFVKLIDSDLLLLLDLIRRGHWLIPLRLVWVLSTLEYHARVHIGWTVVCLI